METTETRVPLFDTQGRFIGYTTSHLFKPLTKKA
jgi:hypothetical protein